MTGDVVDTVALSRLWDERWPGYSKLPSELRAARNRWVRFHALPGSKRYPGTEDEYGIVLARHSTILAELVTGSEVLVVTAGYSDASEPQEPCRSPDTVAVCPDAMYWTSVCMDDEPGFESWMHLYVSQLVWSAGVLDPLLRQVADDVIANVFIADVGLRWLYHPYDGGMDVILSSTAERDALRDRHRDWLSTRPAGL
ncbi:DUF3885 domain-containing protein [Micromonospora haikouensis]|uniref:DUF3885 domain-containing protein n=1 Tax=Micromonospora haikouensis TaxID=686309 RepID=UPI003792AF79